MRTALALLLPVVLAAQSALLEIKVVEGAGAVWAPESRTPGLAIEVTDELGKPVPGALVSIRLPDDGAGGAFTSGLSSEILTADSHGRVVTSPVRWSRVPGTVEIRVTAVKGTLRAGIVTSCEISDKARGKAGVPRGEPMPIRHRRFPMKWVAIGAVAAVAAGFGVARASGGGGSNSNGPGPGTSTTGVSIGSPSITIGNP